MKRFRIIFIFIFIFILLLTGCEADDGISKKSISTNMENEAFNSIQSEEAVKAAELAVHAAEVAATKAFDGCTVGIMKGGSDDEYLEEMICEFEKQMNIAGYSVGSEESSENNILLLCTEGDEEDAIALLTREDIILIICCDMASTERLLYSDNEYRYIGETIAAVGMNEDECKKIEHR